MPVPATPPPEPPAAVAPALARETRSMRLALAAPADAAFPLFGPVREREWSPDWSPRFVWPLPPGQSPDGAVFTTDGEGDAASLWVMTDYDPGQRLVRYVIVHPGRAVGELSIRVAEAGAQASTADVTYRFTALSEAGNAFVGRWSAHFPHLQAHWEHALNARLTAGTAASPPSPAATDRP